MKATFLLGFCALIVCSFCHFDFKSIGRHQWRCKEKLKQRESYTERNERPTLVDNGDEIASQTANELDEAVSTTQGQSSNVEHVQCCCGKKCKGVRGLKAHQRSCRFIKGLNDELYSAVDRDMNQEDDQTEIIEELSFENMPDLKPGVKLPKSDAQWKEADLFFRAELPLTELNESSINACIAKLSDTVYDYFANNFGTMKSSVVLDQDLQERYSNYTKQELKRALKELKRTTPEELRA